ncbi:hypothetical protein [Bradyrhizobium sp. URHD0069]|uniref:hypothetical protein n=1 Tax=Bradyrhizobium sp. URHD0069 TaxID=1380355 RepID=UPI0018CC4427|nr:hypothetical protein [Bradyrhizobium sp. URHD0069]
MTRPSALQRSQMKLICSLPQGNAAARELRLELRQAIIEMGEPLFPSQVSALTDPGNTFKAFLEVDRLRAR